MLIKMKENLHICVKSMREKLPDGLAADAIEHGNRRRQQQQKTNKF